MRARRRAGFFSEIAILPDSSLIKRRLVILISGRGSSMQALVQACRDQGLAGRGRRRHSQPAGRRRAGLGARPGHRRLGPAPQGIRQPRGPSTPRWPRNRPPCAGLRHPGRLHARADAGLRQPFRGSAGEYPSFAAAGLPWPAHPCPGAGHGRARAAAPCISSRRCWTTAPSSPRAACRCWPATRRIRWPIACWKSSTGLFRPPCAGWPKAGLRDA